MTGPDIGRTTRSYGAVPLIASTVQYCSAPCEYILLGLACPRVQYQRSHSLLLGGKDMSFEMVNDHNVLSLFSRQVLFLISTPLGFLAPAFRFGLAGLGA